MNNPVIHIFTNDTITKIATAVNSGVVHNIGDIGGYFQTYRITGDSTPTDKSKFVAMFKEHKNIDYIDATEPIDVYVYFTGKHGKLRVDV